MGSELAVDRESSYPLTSMAVVAQVRLIQEVMHSVMKKDTHYGIIPGCQKPSLWKPGAEKLMVTFRIASESTVEDLSTPDEARYRVTRRGSSIITGAFVGSAVGECSSNEEKYKWRFATCKAEFEATPEDRRRLKYKRDGTTIEQVRTNPADVANTILKMADKRAYVALALNTTAASDIFSQDLEDLPPEIAEGLESGAEPAKPPIKGPEPKKDAPKEAAADTNTLTFVPEAVSVKTGEGKKGPWKKYGIKSPAGEWYGTFDALMGGDALKAKEEKSEITLTWKMEGEYKTVVSLGPKS